MPRPSFTAHPQEGPIGHCSLAQVFGPEGQSVATFDATESPLVATLRAMALASLLNETKDKESSK